MGRKTKGVAGRDLATRQAANDRRNPIGIASRIKTAIVAMAVWGLIPAGIATRLIRRLRLVGV